jgi:translation initiation factor 1
MSNRGKKLNLFIGADIEDDNWSEVVDKKVSKVSNDILEPQKHSLYFSKEKRRGKTVTIVSVFHLKKDEAAKYLKTIKKRLGCGGSFKDSSMEFQGDIKDKLRPILLEFGFRFKHGH